VCRFTYLEAVLSSLEKVSACSRKERHVPVRDENNGKVGVCKLKVLVRSEGYVYCAQLEQH
jgi:hypothetical protein